MGNKYRYTVNTIRLDENFMPICGHVEDEFRTMDNVDHYIISNLDNFAPMTRLEIWDNESNTLAKTFNIFK